MDDLAVDGSRNIVLAMSGLPSSAALLRGTHPGAPATHARWRALIELGDARALPSLDAAAEQGRPWMRCDAIVALGALRAMTRISTRSPTPRDVGSIATSGRRA